MAINYSFKKHQREIAQKKKREEKLQKKLEKKLEKKMEQENQTQPAGPEMSVEQQ